MNTYKMFNFNSGYLKIKFSIENGKWRIIEINIESLLFKQREVEVHE